MLLPQLPPTFQAALRDVNAKTRDARIAAAERLARCEQEELRAATDALCTLTRDVLPVVRVAAVRALGMLELDADASTARDTLRVIGRALVEKLDDRDPRVREQAMVALGQLGDSGDETIQHALEHGLASAYPEVRFQALAGYVETVRHAQPDKVSALLGDADAEVRGQAARALGHFSQAEAGSALLNSLRAALADASLRVRNEAALALAKLGDRACSDALGPALDDATLRHEALDAIGALGLRAHTERVAAMARWVFGSAVDRLAAARALVRLGDPRGVETLRAALRGYRSGHRVLALQITLDLRLAELGEDLAHLAQRPRAAERGLLAEALAAVASKSPAARVALAQLPKESRPA